MSSPLRPLLAAVACLAALPAAAAAQAPPADPQAQAPPLARPAPDECLGFAFGRWTPALDVRAAGHEPVQPSQLQRAPNGRDWAAELANGRDSTLFLFPHWWPVGVRIDLRGSAQGDTLRGTATALVADGRLEAPVAPVRAWRIPCQASAAAGGAPPR